MIRSLAVRHFVTAESLEIDLRSGFIALTGETGAGKSLLINALSFLLGDRADTTMVRRGAAKAELVAEMQVPDALMPAVAAELEAAGLDAPDDGLLLVRRVIEAEGRSRAWINGQMAGLAQLKAIGEMLVDVHGQHAHQSLLRPAAQQALLDRHAGLEPLVLGVSRAYAHWQAAHQALTEAETEASRLAEELENQQWRLELLDEISPQDDEWEALSAEQHRLAHGASLLEAASGALAVLSESDEPIARQVDRLAQQFRGLVEKDSRLTDLLRCLEEASIQISEAGHAASRYLDRLEIDPERLAQVERRVSDLFDAARRLRCSPEELPALHTTVRDAVARLRQAADLDLLRRRLDEAEVAYNDAARALSAARARAAGPFAQAVTGWLAELAMASTQFEVGLNPRGRPSPTGAEDTTFLLRHGSADKGQPLARIASGGELSRVSLAIAATAALATDTPTLIFDEVDAGIGGNTGHVVGRLLQALGTHHQVLVVTHLAQVAARADHHIEVRKATDDRGIPTSELSPLDAQGRMLEIARMLGTEGTAEASQALARELISQAERSPNTSCMS